MKIHFLVLLFTVLLIPVFCYGQESKYEQSFEWVKKTFEENDAGFQYILDKKGKAAYEIHNALTLEQVRKARNMEECTQILNNWLLFFRSGHIGLQLLNDKDIESEDSLKEDELKPVYETENYFKAMFANKPYLKELNETTLLLRIPSFDYHQKADIDKVIQENRERILSTENLIIDLRDNGGGADRSFAEILPLLYTNPIRIVGVEFLSTPLNNQFFQNLATDPAYGLDEEGKKWALDSFQKLNNQLGKFVNIHPEKVRITELDTVYTYPKNVGIIINKGNASTTEQFLLAARQSKKVKLFGTATSGALDVSNVYGVESPNKDLKLYICLSKSLRLPELPIDEIGIQPDYYMDKEIPLYQWVEYTNEILNSLQDKISEEN